MQLARDMEILEQESVREDDNGSRTPMAIWCMMETPQAVINAAAIAAASTRINCLVAGLEDMGGAIGVSHVSKQREPFQFALAQMLYAVSWIKPQRCR